MSNMGIELIVDWVMTALVAVGGVWAYVKAWVAKFNQKMSDFILKLDTKLQEIIELVNNLNKTSAEKKSAAMGMVKQFVESSHQNWSLWEQRVSDKIDQLVKFANEVGERKSK